MQKEKITYIGVSTDLVQNLGTEPARKTLEGSHIIDMTHTAHELIIPSKLTTVPHGTVGDHILVMEFSDPGRVLVDADAVLEDDKVRIGDGVCLD